MSEMSDMNLRTAINDMKDTIAISILANAILSSSTPGEFHPRGMPVNAETRLNEAIDVAKRVYYEKLK